MRPAYSSYSLLADGAFVDLIVGAFEDLIVGALVDFNSRLADLMVGALVDLVWSRRSSTWNCK